MKNRSSFPITDDGVLTFASSFLQTITPDPAAYGLATTDVPPVKEARDKYADLLTLVSNPNTQTPALREAKRDAKTLLITRLRGVVNQAQGWTGMTNEKRAELGLRPRDTKPTPVPPPDGVPVLELQGTWGPIVFIAARDSNGGTNNGKPRGVRQLFVKAWVGGNPPEDYALWPTLCATGRLRFQFQLPANARQGEELRITGCWVSSRNAEGRYPKQPIVTRLGFDGGLMNVRTFASEKEALDVQRQAVDTLKLAS